MEDKITDHVDRISDKRMTNNYIRILEITALIGWIIAMFMIFS